SQEMSPLDEGFRNRIEGIYDRWREAIEIGLKNGLKAKTVKAGTDPKSVAAFVVASITGVIGLAKNTQNTDLMKLALRAMKDYLQGLKN
ncbi:MAG: TetR family transcriptional regulator C-terminal domain-containing protein, partial [Verrucomicrobiota bacterium]